MNTIKIAAAPRFQVPVSLTRPGDEPAGFELSAKPLSRTEHGEWWAALSQAEVMGEPARLVEWALTVFTGCNASFTTGTGEPVPFGADLFALLFDTFPAAPHDLRMCYTRALFESRSGN